MSAFSSIRRERWIIGGALAGIAAVAWAYMIYEARGMSLSGVCQMSRPPDGRHCVH